MLPHHSLQRSLERLTIGVSRAREKRQSFGDKFRTTHREQHYQINISGECGDLPAENTVNITFDVMFIGLNEWHRDSDLPAPHLKTGFELNCTGGSVIPYAYISRWDVDVNGSYLGCEVTIGVHSPQVATLAQASKISFSGVAHLTFLGWGCPVDAVEDTDPGDA